MRQYYTVLGKRVKIQYIDEIIAAEDGIFGDFNGATMTIRVRKDLPKKELESTILHELLHAILFITGQSFVLSSDTEEAFVRALEHGLIDLVELKK